MSQTEELKSAATVENGALKQTIGPKDGLELKSDSSGQSYVEGYIATKDGYTIRGERYHEEALSEEALRSIADQINSANNEIKTADVTFPDPDTLEKTTGNIEHQSTKKMENLLPRVADTSTVPAVRMEEAKFDGYGVKIKAPIRESALPDDTVGAIKQNIKDGVLSAFSVEFKNAKDKIVREGEKVRRKIKEVDLTGVGLTGQPKNPNAVMTAAEIRNVMADGHETSFEEIKEEIKAELMEEIKAKFMFEVGDWVSRDWQGGKVYGKIRDRTKDSFTVDGNKITGEEDEPVYKFEEYDTEQDEFTGQMIAAPQSSLDSWSGAPENKSEHMKSEAGVKFRGTKTGKLDESAIDKDEHNLSHHYLFGSGDDKEDFSYPVVDAEGYLRRGNVQAAHHLGARGGVDASVLERKLKALNSEFDNPPITFKEEEKNISGENMAEETDQGEGQSEDEPENEAEVKSELQETVEELKSTVDKVKSRNDELKSKYEDLKEENEELKNQLEDFEEIQELKSDVEGIEEELKSLTSEDEPVSDPEETKNREDESKTPAELKAASQEFLEEHKSELAEKYNMTEEEVTKHGR